MKRSIRFSDCAQSHRNGFVKGLMDEHVEEKNIYKHQISQADSLRYIFSTVAYNYK